MELGSSKLMISTELERYTTYGSPKVPQSSRGSLSRLIAQQHSQCLIQDVPEVSTVLGFYVRIFWHHSLVCKKLDQN